METNKQSWLERHITLHNFDDAKAEQANYLTHLIGAIIAFAALILILVRNSSLQNKALRIGMVVYGLTTLLLFSASALYHKLPHGDAKRVCRIMDHTNIYFLIAGTYTPLLCYVWNAEAKKVLLILWCFALFGIAFTLIFWGKLRPLHVVIYLLMGWSIVFYWNQIVPELPSGIINWIIAAGITYSLGVIFYAIKTIPHYHAIWHLFCLAASLIFTVAFQLLLY